MSEYSSIYVSEGSDAPVPAAFTGLLYSFAVLSAILGCVSLVRAIVVTIRENSAGSTRRRCVVGFRPIVFYLLTLTMFVRALDMIIWRHNYFKGIGSNESTAQKLTGSMPNYTYFSVYSLLYFMWINFSTKAFNKKSNSKWHYMRFWVYGNLAVYVVWIVLLIIYAVTSHKSAVHAVEYIYASLLALVSAIIFLISGTRLNKRFVKYANEATMFERNASRASLRIANKVKWLTIVFTTVLSIKGILMIAIHFTASHFDAVVLSFVTRYVIQAVCELAPAIGTIVVLWKPMKGDAPTTPQTRSLLS